MFGIRFTDLRPATWVRSLHFQLDLGIGVVCLLATLAAWPLLTRPSLPTFTEAESHIYRTYELMSVWRAGVAYARWAPDLYYGFGYPVFHYYAPLTYYIAAAYGSLLGGPVAGVKFVLGVSVYLGAVGAYLLGRDLWGPEGGIVTAASFSLAPYILFIDPYQRGAAPEMLAISFAPLMFWAFERLRCAPSLRGIVGAAVLVAVVVLSHNLLSFVFLGLILAWLGWNLAFRVRGSSPRSLLMAALPTATAVLLGLALSAFMWFPALQERSAVQYQRAGEDTLKNIGQGLTPLTDLLDSSRADDMLDELRPRIGIAQWLLGIAGLAAWQLKTHRPALVFFALVAAGFTFLQLPESRLFWKALPFITYLQFPWRLLGAIALALAMIPGAAIRGTAGWCGQNGARVASAIAVAICVIGAFQLLDPLPWTEFGPVSPQRIFLSERNVAPGTSTSNEFLPVATLVIPEAQPSLIASYKTGLVDKVNRTTLPQGTTVTVLEHGPIHDRIHISGSNDFVLRLYTFSFPGWKAYVDGVETPVEVAEPEGWITVPVPAGDHDVLVRLEDTPPRLFGWEISGLGVAIALILLSWRRPHHVRESVPYLDWKSALLLGAIILAFLGGCFLSDGTHWWSVPWSDPAVAAAQHQKYAVLEGNIALLAYDLPQTTAAPGAEIPMTFYWRATSRVPADLRVFVHFIGPDGELWGQSDKLYPSGSGSWSDGLPTSRWPTDRYFRDVHVALLRPDAPAGQYRVRVGLWNEMTGVRMHVLDAGDAATDEDAVTLTTTLVVQP